MGWFPLVMLGVLFLAACFAVFLIVSESRLNYLTRPTGSQNLKVDSGGYTQGDVS